MDAVLREDLPETQERQLLEGKMIVAFQGEGSRPFIEGRRQGKKKKKSGGQPAQSDEHMAKAGSEQYDRLLPLVDAFGGVAHRATNASRKEIFDHNSLEYLSGALPRIVQGRR